MTTFTWFVRDKRINAHERAVFDAYREQGGHEHFAATVEIHSEAPGGMRVLLGALTPQGKERVWQAVRVYQGLVRGNGMNPPDCAS